MWEKTCIVWYTHVRLRAHTVLKGELQYYATSKFYLVKVLYPRTPGWVRSLLWKQGWEEREYVRYRSVRSLLICFACRM